MNLVLLHFYSSEDHLALLDVVKAHLLLLRLSDRVLKRSSLDFVRSTPGNPGARRWSDAKSCILVRTA